MSIYVLQRKSRRYQANISGRGQTRTIDGTTYTSGFSLNGGTRNQGWIGQGVRGRTIVGTKFRGALPMGNGGCCGTYSQNIVNGGPYIGPPANPTSVNDAGIIKRSNMNTRGYINSAYINPTGVLHPGCNSEAGCRINNIVKDFSPENHSQDSRIQKLKKQNSTCVVLKSDAGKDSCIRNCKSASYHIGGKKIVRTMYSKNYNKFAMSSSQYQNSSLMASQNLPTPPCKQHFPPALSHNKGTCQINVNTPQEAIATGVLPTNWMNCGTCEHPGNAIKLPTNSQNIRVQTSLNNYTDEQVALLFGQKIYGSNYNLSVN